MFYCDGEWLLSSTVMGNTICHTNSVCEIPLYGPSLYVEHKVFTSVYEYNTFKRQSLTVIQSFKMNNHLSKHLSSHDLVFLVTTTHILRQVQV